MKKQRRGHRRKGATRAMISNHPNGARGHAGFPSERQSDLASRDDPRDIRSHRFRAEPSAYADGRTRAAAQVTSWVQAFMGSRVMRRILPGCIGVVLIATPSGGSAQLLSERVDGLERTCTYAGFSNIITDAPTRTYRVGIGQNCPFTHSSPTTSALPVPPTAQLRSETVTAAARACVYEQAGSAWTLTLSPAQPCPLAAGMIEHDADAARRSDTGAAGPRRFPR